MPTAAQPPLLTFRSMNVAYLVLAVVIALVATMSAVMKLKRDPKVLESIQTVRFPAEKLPLLAALELAGAAGVILGFWVKPLGIAAAVGLVLYFICAAGSHVRVSDTKGIGAPVVLALIAAVVVALTISQA
jgi:uncharacterized membrane protein YphA (DoxX/SURF4 family)